MLRLFSAVALSTLVLSGVSPVAVASTKTSSQTVSGVIVKYAARVDAEAKNGEPTGANLLKGVTGSEDLGGGLYVLKLANEVSQMQLRSWVDRMVLDRRIEWAELDLAVDSQSVAPQTFRVPEFTKARAATAPRSLSARASLSAGSRDKARIRLSWSQPGNRYGAKIVGYQIQYSTNGGSTYRTLISNTGSNDTRVFVSDGIRAGVSYRFRVRAITNDGSAANTLGALSNAAGALVRTAPKPVLVTSAVRVGPGNVSYRPQSLSDRGGFAASQVRYRAVATAPDIESVESALCDEKRCRFPTLLPDVSYNVEVFATNAVGKSSSLDAENVNDFYFPFQWYLNGQFGISMPNAWKYTKGESSKVVAVIDTGIREHQQLSKALLRNPDGSIYGYDFVSDLNSAADGDGEDPNPNDEGGGAGGDSTYHGTFVAGIIASEHDFIGTSGVAPKVKILPIRALGRDSGTMSDLVKAVNWAAGEKITGVPRNRYPVSVINLSLGAREPVACDAGFSSVFKSAISKGVTIVAAAGNEGRPSLSFPANCPGVVTVVASQSLGDRASYSNFGEGALVAAPGGEQSIGSLEAPDSQGRILSAGFNSSGLEDYVLAEGTSMAAPVVSGIVALMYSMQPNISPSRVRTILANSVQDFPVGSNCSITGGCGAGIINAQLALARTSALR